MQKKQLLQLSNCFCIQNATMCVLLFGALLALSGCGVRRGVSVFGGDKNSRTVLRAQEVEARDGNLPIQPGAFDIKRSDQSLFEKQSVINTVTFSVKETFDAIANFYRDESERLGWQVKSTVQLERELFMVIERPHKQLLLHAMSKRSKVMCVRLFVSDVVEQTQR